MGQAFRPAFLEQSATCKTQGNATQGGHRLTVMGRLSSLAVCSRQSGAFPPVVSPPTATSRSWLDVHGPPELSGT